MSDTLYLITNSKGSGDWTIVYETRCGETLYAGHGDFRGKVVFDLLQQCSGGYDNYKYVELDDDQIEEWQEHI
jgi:hypothetical protein